MTPPAPSPLQLQWTALTDVGRCRRHNEDAFIALSFDRSEARYLGKTGEGSLADEDYMFAVSDGIGGAVAGEYVSHLAVKAVMDLVSRTFHQNPGSIANKTPGAILNHFFLKIHEQAIRVSAPYAECENMGATLSLGWFHKERLALAHIGDSRIYRLPSEGGIAQLSVDHTPSGRLCAAGRLSEREARRHPSRNKLDQSIGSGLLEIHPQILELDVAAGDCFLFCTDGVTDGLWDRSIEKFIRTPPPYLDGLSAAERLIREARDASGRDNITAVVVDVRAPAAEKK